MQAIFETSLKDNGYLFRRSIPAFTSFFRNFAKKWRNYSVSAKKETGFFVLLSTFRNFVRILSFSLSKGSMGD